MTDKFKKWLKDRGADILCLHCIPDQIFGCRDCQHKKTMTRLKTEYKNIGGKRI